VFSSNGRPPFIQCFATTNRLFHYMMSRCRFQATLPGDPLPYRSTLGGLFEIAKKQGISGWYKGWEVTSARAAFLTSAQLGSYDTIKNNILIKLVGMEDGLQLHFAASMTAGIITTTAANPLDVIKTRYMSDKQGKYTSPVHCLVTTFREEGVRGFFRGWMPAYWRLGPHTVLSFMLMEHVRKYFGLSTV
jgi:Mitochondrial carrier protein